MKKARLIHNKGAGAGSFTKKELLSLLQGRGYDVDYYDAGKKDGMDWDEEDDLLIVAGGDGTVRKLVKRLVERRLIDKRFPIAVMPLGTANNIAKTLYHHPDPIAVIAEWGQEHTRHMDIARVRGVKGEAFCMEGFGVGVFPQLMKEIKEEDERHLSRPKKAIRTAQQLLCEIVRDFQPRYCKLIIDGADYSDKYVMVEVMNMQSVGPNLLLAPEADPSDGYLDVVMVPSSDHQKLAAYARHKAEGREANFDFQTVRARNVFLQWEGNLVHVDDQLMKLRKGKPVHVELEKGLIEFYVDGDKL